MRPSSSLGKFAANPDHPFDVFDFLSLAGARHTNIRIMRTGTADGDSDGRPAVTATGRLLHKS